MARVNEGEREIEGGREQNRPRERSRDSKTSIFCSSIRLNDMFDRYVVVYAIRLSV